MPTPIDLSQEGQQGSMCLRCVFACAQFLLQDDFMTNSQI